MFWDCSRLQTLDLSNWDMGSEINFGGMFYNCNSLKEVKMIGCSEDTIEKIKSKLPEGVRIIANY